MYVGAPGTTSTTVYTVPANTTTILKNIVMSNTAATPATITINVAGVGIVNSYSVSANDSVIMDMSLVLSAGDVISALQGTSNAINLFLSGVEVS
jgi:hypothetical protein